jgi:carbon storage regulator
VLLLSRKKEQEIVIQGDIIIKVLDIYAERVVLGIEAPATVSVNRAEVQNLIDEIDAKEASE